MIPTRNCRGQSGRRLILRAVLRGLLNTTVLVVLYYLLPLDRPWNTGAVVRLLAGLLVFAGITVWQVRTIARARYPGSAGSRGAGLDRSPLPAAVRLDVFRDGTSLGGELHPAADPHRTPCTSAVTVFSTVGFGDITPKSEAARIVLIVQMLGDLAVLGAGIRVLLGAVQRGRQQRPDTGGGAGPAAT